uniref:Uncharacterized protein n=1 Tax=Chromera velia CCMP2878 TaxID=1169474 RepID=A0A0G4HMV7_9ALVE|eukprot:Cvel_7518.t1-p1 / transcript=Cvel_7518.t1 / gene=Cvel_7518 / organism=Chromera_velia_CCMP2878 / gene_product=hypothetical protein / transcript_product=hypothetical protein / location=Cvel_scaffold395:19110-20909(+) / protein_length=500 / sequence_SO=supercontig / SO=protein_coding / is_pseudo=false
MSSTASVSPKPDDLQQKIRKLESDKAQLKSDNDRLQSKIDYLYGVIGKKTHSVKVSNQLYVKLLYYVTQHLKKIGEDEVLAQIQKVTFDKAAADTLNSPPLPQNNRSTSPTGSVVFRGSPATTNPSGGMQNALQAFSPEAEKIKKQKRSSKGAPPTTSQIPNPKRGSQGSSSSFAAAAAAAAATTAAPQARSNLTGSNGTTGSKRGAAPPGATRTNSGLPQQRGGAGKQSTTQTGRRSPKDRERAQAGATGKPPISPKDRDREVINSPKSTSSQQTTGSGGRKLSSANQANGRKLSSPKTTNQGTRKLSSPSTGSQANAPRKLSSPKTKGASQAAAAAAAAAPAVSVSVSGGSRRSSGALPGPKMSPPLPRGGPQTPASPPSGHTAAAAATPPSVPPQVPPVMIHHHEVSAAAPTDTDDLPIPSAEPSARLRDRRADDSDSSEYTDSDDDSSDDGYMIQPKGSSHAKAMERLPKLGLSLGASPPVPSSFSLQAPPEYPTD